MHSVIRNVTGLAAAAVLSVAAGACSNPIGPEGPAGPAGSTAIKGEPGLGAEMAAVRAATAKYHDVATAIAAGYANPATGVCDQIAIGTMGVHSSNPALLGNQVLDPENPEVLLYLPTNGGFRLVAVEYVQIVLLRNRTTGMVAPWGAPARWSDADYEVVTPTPQLFEHVFEGPMPGHVPGMPWHWDLHAWVWANNPNGMFAQWNPSISCP